MSTVKLKGGTIVHVDGLPVSLGGDTDVECASENHEALRAHSAVPFQEYPKMLSGGKVVASAEEEAAWSAPTPAPVADEAEPANPLDDVEVEMDNPAYNEPTKKKPAAHAAHGGAKKK